MSKRLILILAFALAVGITCAAYAEVQNVKVSGDLTVQGISRNNIILRKDAEAPRWAPTPTTDFVDYEHRISAALSQVRVRIDADLTDNVSTTVRLLNERLWGEERNSTTTDDTEIALDLAYVAVKEFLYSPLSLTVGRQELMFGNGLIIGDVDTNGICAGHGTGVATAGSILPKSLDDLSLRKAFDAVRATLNYDPLIVDAVYAKVDENLVDEKDDVNLYGVNANYALDANTTLEGYYWEKRREKAAKSSGDGSATGGSLQSRDDITRTLGTRVEYRGIANLLASLEGAWQFGKHIKERDLYPDEGSDDNGARRREGYAIQAITQYNLSDLMLPEYAPAIGASWTLLSGDPYRSVDKRFRGWDPMYENQAGGTLFNKILGYSNAQLYNISASAKPMEDVKLALDYYYLRFIKPYRSADVEPYGVNLTGIAGDPTYEMVVGEKEIGSEIDAKLTYDYTEDVQLGLSMGWFFPGDAFSSENDETASQVIGSMKVTF